jgi:hypothetical protein
MRAAPFSRARVKIWCMKVPVLLWMAAACAACLLAPTTAEAMHNGDLASAAEKLRTRFGVEPHSLAALNNLGTGFPGRDQDHWSAR